MFFPDARNEINEWITDVDTSGFHVDFYEDHAQAFHFWAMLNTRAQGGNAVAILGDAFHECHGIPNPGVIADARLGSLAVRIGDDIYNELMTPLQLAERIRGDLNNAFSSELAPWYYTYSPCERFR